MNLKDRMKTVRTALVDIEKQFGKGAVMWLGDEKPQDETVAVISTGSVSLDHALGIGGLPRGRMVEVFGPEGSGKTTLALQAIASIQRQGGIAAFIDAEHALDPKYARSLGIQVETLLVSQPDHGEQALEITETLLRSGAVDLIVVDSVAALVPKAELDGEMGDAHVGLHARLMSQAMRKLTGVAAKTRSTILFINQIRQKIGVSFGNPETTTGGNALKFYASIRLDVRRVGTIKEGEEACGNRVRVRVVKNKLAAPFRDAEFDVLFGHGVSQAGEILDLAENRGWIEKSGSWFTLGDVKMGQGRERARSWLGQRPGLMDRIRTSLLSPQGSLADLGPIEAFEPALMEAPSPA